MLTTMELIPKKIGLPTHFQLLLEEITRIKDKFPKSFDKIAQILALARPLIELVLANCGYADLSQQKGKRGPVPTPMTTLMFMQILSET